MFRRMVACIAFALAASDDDRSLSNPPSEVCAYAAPHSTWITITKTRVWRMRIIPSRGQAAAPWTVDEYGRSGYHDPYLRRPLLPSALCRGDHDVAVVDGSVIALEKQRSRIRFDAIERAAGDTWNLAVADDRGAVQIVGDHPADARDIHRLPLAGRTRDAFAGGDEPIHAAEMMR